VPKAVGHSAASTVRPGFDFPFPFIIPEIQINSKYV
jgi:hypothetical protein